MPLYCYFESLPISISINLLAFLERITIFKRTFQHQLTNLINGMQVFRIVT